MSSRPLVVGVGPAIVEVVVRPLVNLEVKCLNLVVLDEKKLSVLRGLHVLPLRLKTERTLVSAFNGSAGRRPNDCDLVLEVLERTAGSLCENERVRKSLGIGN